MSDEIGNGGKASGDAEGAMTGAAEGTEGVMLG